MYSLNSKFGNEQDWKDLVDAVHARDMFIMVDVAINHYANQGETIKYSDFVPFNHSSYFHPRCDIDWGNQTSCEVVRLILFSFLALPLSYSRNSVGWGMVTFRFRISTPRTPSSSPH